MERPAAGRPVSRGRCYIRYQLWLRPILGKLVHVFRRLPNVPIPPKPARRAKESSEFRLIGKPANRLDAPAKSTGGQTFGMDMRRPEMKTVLIARPPHIGGTVASFDPTQVQAVKGVDHVLRDGEIEQSNFDRFVMPRMPDMPAVDVHIVPSDDPPTGVGEPGLPPLAPAMANALFALTGKPVEALPIRL